MVQLSSYNDKKEYNNDPVFDFEQSLYEYALVLAEFENDPWKDFSIKDIPILQEISNEETGNEYTEEIFAIKTKQIKPSINNSSYTEKTCNS
ncbi:37707_t:CDS:2 [Gigaspora margarita]|uniref:37707_t:CDS:1 n=1 Tax=Gigaspora margarita TaxID=4874 RepID=A0ABN7UKS0_GIGMA|nr:37707_t:CDS:2 [Gigaspora margarita]